MSLRFCRSCYSVLGDNETTCHACGTPWRERKPKDDAGLASSQKLALSPRMEEAKRSAQLIHEVGKEREYQAIGIRKGLPRIQTKEPTRTITKLRALASTSRDSDTRHESAVYNGIAIVAFIVILGLKLWFAVGKPYETWDGYVYLLNARSIAAGSIAPPNYFEVLRPPLYPFIIGVIWHIFGENIILAKVISPIFTVGAAWLLYSLLKEMFDSRSGLFASIGFLLSPVVMSNTDLVLVHAVGVLFVTLTATCVWRARKEPMYYLIAGMAAALASLTRYPDFLIAPVAMFFVIIHLRDRPRERWAILKGAALGAVAFVGLWLPWLLWCQGIWGDPFISLKLGLISGTATSPGRPDYFYYVEGLPVLFTWVGVGLLVLGLISKSWVKDRRRLLLATWFLVFLVFYSAVSNQDLRYMVEWTPALLAVIGIGISSSYLYLKAREIRIRRITYGLLSTVVGVWLILLLVGSLAAEIPSLSVAYYETGSANEVFDSVTGFQSSVSWLAHHMTTVDIGVTDLPPYFMYYTNRLFYDWNYARGLASGRNISMKDALILLHVKYAVFRDTYVMSHNITTLTFLTPTQSFNGYTIYTLTST